MLKTFLVLRNIAKQISYHSIAKMSKPLHIEDFFITKLSKLSFFGLGNNADWSNPDFKK
jgi:hypothetical protein